MNFDRTGYPEIGHEWGQATLSRIVAVADCFDAMTAHRAYHAGPYSPFEALQYLLGPTRVSFDPAVLWALVRTVGLYPAGLGAARRLGPRRALARARIPTTCAGRSAACWSTPTAAPPRRRPRSGRRCPPASSVTRVLRPEEHTFNTAEQLAA